MPAFLENDRIDTSSIVYSETGIRLLKFVKNVFGDDVLEKIKKGEMVIMFNRNELKYNEKFRDRRVKEHTDVTVRYDAIQVEIPEDMFS